MGHVTSLAILDPTSPANPTQQPLLLSGSTDGSARTWDLRQSTPAGVFGAPAGSTMGNVSVPGALRVMSVAWAGGGELMLGRRNNTVEVHVLNMPGLCGFQ